MVDIFLSQNVPLLKFIKQDVVNFDICLQFNSVALKNGLERRWQFFFCLQRFMHRNQDCVVKTPTSVTKKTYKVQ